MRCVLSAFADEYSQSLDKQLLMLRENNIGYLEPRFIDGKNISDFSENKAKELKKRLDDAGIRISSIGSPLGKISVNDDFAPHLETAKRTLQTANILDTDKIRVFSFYVGKTNIEQHFEKVAERLSLMLDEAERAGVTLCHENEGGVYGETPDHCRQLMDALPRLGCVFDMGNFALKGYDPIYAYGLLKDRIKYFHIKDALAAGAIVPPGRGEAKIAEILGDFTKEREVIITLEPHLETFDGLGKLVNPDGKQFDNPYKFESREAAFLAAIKAIREIIA